MRALSDVELVGLRILAESENKMLPLQREEVAFVEAAYARGCAHVEWIPFPGDPLYECKEYTLNELGRLALRVAHAGTR